MRDNVDVDCTLAREALSARIDGEREPVPSVRTDEHLDSCVQCQAWYAAASEATRGLRIGAAVRTPDLTSEILAAVGVPIPRGRPQRAVRWVVTDHPWRAVLAVVAIAQLALGATQIFGIGHDHSGEAMVMGPDAMAGHLFNESTAWNVAVGVGFLVAAWRPRTTAGLMPVLATFTVLLAAFVITDTISGAVTAERVASHAIIAIGVLVTAMVRRSEVDGSPSPHRRVEDTDDFELPEGTRYGRRRGHLRDSNDPAA
ncbi:hypothetical protein CH252_30600 [Rhodococcus sp. 06-1477-1B]|nr:hypothetical protein CH252_30600 [Rhodococcus sp. 06-1477-1B]OZD53758.1 hypothetical protein CH266_04235 [Rhodococcus sp. 06-1474-1B]